VIAYEISMQTPFELQVNYPKMICQIVHVIALAKTRGSRPHGAKVLPAHELLAEIVEVRSASSASGTTRRVNCCFPQVRPINGEFRPPNRLE
jgi:hypothetical protein